MKIIRKDTMPNGVKIQLEDWSEHNTEEYPDLYGLTIAAYPIARNSGTYGIIHAHECFRLQISANIYANYSNANVSADYDKLVSGQKTLQDLAPHFWNGKKDEWYLGMIEPGTDEWYKANIRYGIKCGFSL